MREDFRVWQPIDVRWADMDAYGHVNNAKYFTYCESARIRYFDELDIDTCREDPNHGPAVVTATCNFHKQVHYPSDLEVGVRATHIGHKSFTLEYGIFRAASEEIVADGSSVVVWVDYAQGESIPVPFELAKRIRELDQLIELIEGSA